ncbi:MAG: rhodanese-like domain-containing protein [Ruminococcaceae bacterium]|nr:rhodanese-like domain-containing protein [Oscillospiraceae bacterium]MBO5024340.1 rhodanese-like domain-containing protein [Clostridia bacterium]
MKKLFTLFLTLCLIFITSCGDNSEKDKGAVYMNITAKEAKETMDSETGYVILDVRTEEEFAEGHIPGAILIPDYEIKEKAPELLPDKDVLILVYCRSGRRSKLAAEKLVSLGYTNIREFGGIIDWEYEIEK